VHTPSSSRALCAPSVGVGSGLWSGSARLGPRCAKSSGSMAGPHRPSECCALAGRAQFQPDGHLKIENSFLFLFRFQFQFKF
jgi:hypothetical protein